MQAGRLFLFVVAMASGAAVCATAQEAACGPVQDQTGMSVCAMDGAQLAAAEMAGRLAEIRARLAASPDQLALFDRAQAGWQDFRDAECAFTGSGLAGGSAQPMVVAHCRRDLTRQRLEHLDRLLDCPEGDLACPVPRP